MFVLSSAGLIGIADDLFLYIAIGIGIFRSDAYLIGTGCPDLCTITDAYLRGIDPGIIYFTLCRFKLSAGTLLLVIVPGTAVWLRLGVFCARTLLQARPSSRLKDIYRSF